MKIQNIIKKFGTDSTQLINILNEIQHQFRHIPIDCYPIIAKSLNISPTDVEGVASFYHFYSNKHRGDYTIYCNTSSTAELNGSTEIIKAFENELRIKAGETTPDEKIGLFTTSCIGMCDQEPAILINDRVFTKITPERVKIICKMLKKSLPIYKITQSLGDGNNSHNLIKSEVQNNIYLKGPVFFNSSTTPGDALKLALQKSPSTLIEEISKSGLRGRGGAGFPTGKKWDFCRSAKSNVRYVICNADEGEPGTFKDRVLLTERAGMIFEGMAIAGYAIGSTKGILYLRAEYLYLKKFLENQIKKMKELKLLGEGILSSDFHFDIEIKMGAGAYICGEESALIESAEGKRGQPRNRPPFPVVSGYLNKPTIVNNPETFGCAVKIVLNGSEWFQKMGTPHSTGVKLLSISGDCEKPGIYEIEWGLTIKEVLHLCGAKDTLAVQVGGPSGVCISENQFHRKLCYSDLATGGAFIIYNKTRDLLSILHNHMEFFVNESCGFCVPCRSGNILLLKQLEKIMKGHGSLKDLEDMKHLGNIVKSTSRCGLGQTSPHPVLSSLDNFNDYFKSKVKSNEDFISDFDLSHAIEDSYNVTHRKLNLKTI